MKFYILASLIIFCIVIHHAISRNDRISEREERDFWERERKANETRKKNLDGLPYVQIPLEQLPLDTLTEDETVQSCISDIRELAGTKIVNLTGYTNTDLKLEYGTANITALSQFDQSYTLLATTLQKWADALWEAGETSAAVTVMEFAISTRTDVSRTYYLLAAHYRKEGDTEKLSRLTETAEKLRSSNRQQILRHLADETSSAFPS